MKKLVFVMLVSIGYFAMSFSAQGQTQPPISREIGKAFQDGTRSTNGLPGVDYWQNRADYNITAEVDVQKSQLRGQEKITYFNNSPDTLTKLVLRLYPDFYKKGNARSWPIGPEGINEGTQINKLVINQMAIDPANRDLVQHTVTNMHVQLATPLYPGDSLVIETDWSFIIPTNRPVRMGKYSDNIVFVAYWYPQIAVYDDIDGWDEIEYMGTVEFYNDFNNYNVNISVPDDYKVWATGDLHNIETHYVPKVLHRLTEAKKTGAVTSFFTTEECRDKKVLLKSEGQPWQFIANEVPDFSFGLAKEIFWDGSFVTVDTLTGRKVLVDAVYPDSSLTFTQAAKWSAMSVNIMSLQMPGVPFPYPHITSFSNGRRNGGMESPMMAIDGDPSSETQAFGLFFHEISHSYFPFYMGANERKYAWMDEGWAAYMTNEIMEQLDPEYGYFERLVSTFEGLNGSEREVPLMYLSYQIQDYSSYRVHAYNRSALALAYLRDVLGDQLFKKAYQQFIYDWHGLHPGPYDFFNSFSQTAQRDLWWYFTPWYFNRDVADLGIKKVTFDNKIVIENVGGLPLPVILAVTYSDGSEEHLNQHTGVWSVNLSAVVVQADPARKIIKVVLGSPQVPDVNLDNNTITPHYN